MKIAMMTRWNVPSGQSAHAEPVGRVWLEMGHDLKVLAPAGLDTHLRLQEDEPFVRRCYMMDVWGQRAKSDYFFDRQPFLEEDYDVFLVEDVEVMPMAELLEIFPLIRKKARTILVAHEVGLSRNPDWYRFEWDAIVCFDERYKRFLATAFPSERVHIIPFPCHAVVHGDKGQAREQLGLPADGKIVLAYGFNIARSHVDLFPVMQELERDYPVRLLLVTHHGPTEHVPKAPFLLLRDEMPRPDRLYSYLHASDVYLFYVRRDEEKTKGVGVSSSVAVCLGAGRPVLVPGYCNFFDLSGREVVKYDDLRHLERRLRDAFEGTPAVRESLVAAEEYAAMNSGPEIARRFLELFERVTGGSSLSSAASIPGETRPAAHASAGEAR
jgi:hypothetical protein